MSIHIVVVVISYSLYLEKQKELIQVLVNVVLIVNMCLDSSHFAVRNKFDHSSIYTHTHVLLISHLSETDCLVKKEV